MRVGRVALKTKISTPRLAESIAFYRSVFDMRMVEQWDKPQDRGAILEFDGGDGEAFLEVYYSEKQHDFSGLSLQFKVEDVDRFRAGLPPGVPAHGPVPRPWGARYLYMEDPNGVQIIVYSGGN